jgi:CheY-like chemotaxis protein
MRRRALIADRHPDSRAALVSLCQVLGYDVEDAADAADALVRVVAFRPEVLVIDLPPADTSAIARSVRDGGNQTLFIIALMQSGRPGERNLALEAGCDAAMLKPGELTKFYALLADSRQQRRRLARSGS